MFYSQPYEKGEVKVGYQNPFKVINTVQNENPNVDFISIEGGIIQTRAVPRSQDVIAKHSVYLDLDISQSNITAKEDTKIGEIWC